jgi:hypothetical protein
MGWTSEMDDLDRFKGYDEISVACIIALRRAANSEQRVAPHEERVRVKYGCTCNACDGGFLSKRMRAKLLRQLDRRHDLQSGYHNSEVAEALAFIEALLQDSSAGASTFIPSVRNVMKN